MRISHTLTDLQEGRSYPLFRADNSPRSLYIINYSRFNDLAAKLVFMATAATQNDVTRGRNLGFSNFQFFSYTNINTKNRNKTTFSDLNLQNSKIHCKVISI